MHGMYPGRHSREGGITTVSTPYLQGCIYRRDTTLPTMVHPFPPVYPPWYTSPIPGITVVYMPHPGYNSGVYALIPGILGVYLSHPGILGVYLSHPGITGCTSSHPGITGCTSSHPGISKVYLTHLGISKVYLTTWVNPLFSPPTVKRVKSSMAGP